MELIYLLFIISGWIKADLVLFGITLPFDVTVIFTGLLILSMIIKWNSKINTNVFLAIIFLLLFYFWLLFTLTYTLSGFYSKEKALYFLLNIIAFIYPALVKDFNVNRFFRFLVLASLFLGIINVTVIMAYQLKLISYALYTPWKGQYLRSGMYLGLSSVVIFSSKFELFSSKTVSYVLFISSTVLMIMSGARAPVIFTLGVCFLYWIFAIKKTMKISRYVSKERFIIVGSIVVLIAGFGSTIIAKFAHRFNILIDSLINNDNGQINPRLRFLQSAFHSIFESWQSFLFGKGIASYGIVVYDIDGRFYPHNIIVEILFELGLVGLILFFIFTAFAIIKSKKTSFVLVSVFYIFLNALKSNSLIDLRILFALFAIVAILYNEPRNALLK